MFLFSDIWTTWHLRSLHWWEQKFLLSVDASCIFFLLTSVQGGYQSKDLEYENEIPWVEADIFQKELDLKQIF